MIKTQFDEQNLSTLKVFTNTKPLKEVEARTRDSGYMTDFSPASATSASAPRQFRFDSDIDEFDFSLEEGIEKLEVCDDVFPKDGTESIDDGGIPICESDIEDREVEELFSDSGELGQHNSMTQPVEITPRRPGAPVPIPNHFPADGLIDTGDSVNGDNDVTDYSISQSYHHTPWNINRNCRGHVFRPISRSVGTQTPSPVSQIMTEAITGLRGDSRFQPYRLLPRGVAATRPRFQSESEDDGSEGPLPDLIPHPRDRSLSLPEVQALRLHSEQQVGRELRRISDEFHSSFHRVRPRRTAIKHAASFPLSLASYWNSLRRYLSPVQHDLNQEDRSHRDSQWH